MVMKKIILIVIGDKTSSAVIETALTLKHWVMPLSSAEKMFNLLWKINPDLIFLDFEIPDMHGFDVIRKLKSDFVWKNIPIVLLTNIEDENFKIKAVDEGVVAVINKPAAYPILLDCVERYAK